MVKFAPGRMRQSLVFDYQFERLSALVADMEEIRKGSSVEDLAGDAPYLDRWALGKRPAASLIGYASGHPVLPGTGRLIATSDLCLISEDGRWARTLSRWYRLGDPLDSTDPERRGNQAWQ
jgi:hypothetical protein